ncbi:MAG: T9SS type A sorting domain-containing protein [Candidatus Eisenbacteria bacterium]|uniref:T9SS type A sorting domain-containing protein n=1 Tax=Eiseniibacteriota bacterium TaxID=2212470 RepID=A0A7Y2E551_UNCEI|nr:T9SS type A sorting domain-containing protein [Candidatus Eisenbacteria bacterium]
MISKPEGIELTWDLNRGDGILGYSVDRKTGSSDWIPIQPLHVPVIGENRLFDSLASSYAGAQISYRVRAILNGGTYAELEGHATTQFLPDAPGVTQLNAPYPNPVPRGAPATIAFTLEESNPTEVQVFSANGRLVKTLASDRLGPGSIALAWDGTDSRGERVASGVYFVHLTSGSFESTQRLVLVP